VQRTSCTKIRSCNVKPQWRVLLSRSKHIHRNYRRPTIFFSPIHAHVWKWGLTACCLSLPFYWEQIERSHTHWSKSKSKLSYDRRPVIQSVLYQTSIWDPRPISFSLPCNLSRHLRFCQYCAPCLTRGCICTLWFLLGFTSAVCLGSESCRTHNHILLSQLGRAGSCICYPRNRAVQFNFQASN
jgi:hypothetical protein